MLFISLLVSACSSIPNFSACKELAPDRAKCIKVITNEKYDWDDSHFVNGKTYWDARPTMLQIPADSYADLKAYLLKECKRTNKCTELEAVINTLDQTKNSF